MRLLLALAFLVAVSRADEVVLRSGGRLDCEILEETATHVRIRLPHGTMIVPRSRIAELVREKKGAYLRREGRASLRRGSTGPAGELHARAYANNPADQGTRQEYVDALLADARALRARYMLVESFDRLEVLLEVDPGHAVALALAEELRKTETKSVGLHNRAVAALRAGDLDRALELFDAWRLRRPVGDRLAKQRMATAHLAAGKASAQRGTLRDALDHFRSAASFGAVRETREALFVLAPIAALEALSGGDQALAARTIDAIRGRYPDPSVPVFLRAVAFHVGGDVEKAVQAYADAARLAARTGKVQDALPYETVRRYATAMLRAAVARPPQEGTRRWRELFLKPLESYDEGAHFVVYASSRERARELAIRADALYEAIARELLGRLPDASRAELIVHPTRQAYVAADPIPPNSPMSAMTLSRPSTAGVTYDSLDEAGKRVVRIEAYEVQGLAEDTLPHEVVHVVQRRGLKVHRRGHWLDEGVAMLFESERSRRARIAGLRGVQLIPLAELVDLRSTPRSKGALFYSEACALAVYLRELDGEEAWRRFLDAYAGQPFEQALAVAYSIKSTDLLERDWLAWIRKGRNG